MKTYYQAAQPKGREGREEAWRQNLQPPGAPLTQNVMCLLFINIKVIYLLKNSYGIKIIS